MAFWEEWTSFLDGWSFYGNSVEVWTTAVLVAVVTFIGLWIIKRVVVGQVYRFTQYTRIKTDNMVAKAFEETRFYVLFLLALYAGSLILDLPERVDAWLGAAAFAIFLLQVGIWGNAFIQNWTEEYRSDNLEEHASQVTTMRAVSFVARLVLFSILLLIALDNIPGIEVTALIASLGIGGVAVALAVQNILGDLFASLSIALDKPFVIGDFILVGDLMGTVEQIGLKTTRVRSLSGEQLIFANNDLLQSRIRNFKRMQERRVLFSIGVTYDTPAAKLKRIPELIRDIVESQELVRFDRAHFKEFGDSALIFEIVYFVLSNDYNVYMDIQQAINLALYARFEAEEIEFAYPTQTIYLENAFEAQVDGADKERAESWAS